MKNVTYINAGAGSGKTYTLSHTLTDLIKNGISPEQVILTTFTKKAASEFKVEAKSVLFQEGLYDEAVRLEHALIGTVHSVCQQLISKYWFVLGLSPNMGVMSEEDATFYISQSLAELPTDDELKLMHAFCRNFDIQRVENFVSMGLNYDFWQDDLKKIIGLATNYEIDSFESSCDASLQFIRRFVRKDTKIAITDEELKQVLAEAHDYVDCSRRIKNKESYLKKIDDVRSESKHRTFAWYMKLVDACPSSYGATCALINERLAYLWNSEDVYELQEKYIRLLFDLAQRWKEKFAQFKREKNLLDYNDMEKYMNLLMSNKDIASELSKSYRYLFVDEFQDSSPIQVKIFDALSELMEHSYWVGDYKQAIYGFRGSDTALTKAVVDVISAGRSVGCDTRTLDTSYRSLPDIVEVNNRVFKQTFKGILPEENIVLKQKKENKNGIDCLRYIRTNKDITVADHILKLVAEGVRPADIGVIARTNRELDSLADNLNRLGVSMSREDLSVVESRTYMLVISLLRIISSEHDSLAKANVAMLVVEDFSTRKLIEERLLNLSDEAQNESDFLAEIPLIRQVGIIRKKLKQQSIAAMIESMVVELNLYNIVNKLEVDSLSGAMLLQALINSGKTYEEHCLQMNLPTTIEGYIAYVDAVQPKGQGDPKGVQLHTYHSCKGLQWKYVILMSLQKVTLDENKLIRSELYGVHVLRTEKPGVDNLYPEVSIRMVPWIYGAKRSVPDGIHSVIAQLDELKDAENSFLSEENRILYVGMTRPSEVLILDLEHSKKGSLLWFQTEGLQSVVTSQPEGDCDLLGVDMPFTDYTVTDEDFKEEGKAFTMGDEDHLTQLRIADPTFDSFPLRNLAPSKEQGVSAIVDNYNFGARIPLAKQPKDMAVVGDCIHQIFAAIEDSKPDYQIKLSELIDSYELRDVLASVQEIGDAWQNLVTFMTDKYGVAEEKYHERPFVYDRDGQRYTGSIDLVWRTYKGDILVDYKTCPMGEKAILDPQSEHFVGLYGGQLSVYASALEAAGEKVLARYIYYPVSGILVQLE